MTRYRNLGLVLLAALASGRLPAAAQDRAAAPLPDTTQLALVFIVFPDEAGAQQALTGLHQSDTATAGQIEDYAVVSRGQDGKVKLQQSSPGETAGSTRAENAVNGVVAHWVAGGGNTERQAGVSGESMNKMGDLLKRGTSGVVAVTMEPYLPSVVKSLQRGGTTQVMEANVAAPGATPSSEGQ
ncbi:MAG: hypothetical protein QOH59_1500 [Gemmatimonadales bacterium]|jgi:hypothetical protein|nr:hypothetical protein [Gemmatimonadales bacterium]